MRMQLIGNRYRIKGLIGEGGMASVYAAIDEKLDRRVAIKILHSHLARNADIRKRFHQEARSISGIDHPNIIKVYDFSGDTSDQLWIVTEILYGVDLAEYVEKYPKHRLHPLVATLMCREICKALSEAHRHGIIHRDIKPENIMVLDAGRVKLMDFGIAKVAQSPSATQTGTFMGSPSYMSPEQIRGIRVDGRTDIYSLSVLLYEILCGNLPYMGNNTADVINKIMIGKFSPPIAINPNIPRSLNQIVLNGMNNDRDKRYADINQFASELDQFLTINQLNESHVELERFFKKPKEFDRKLTKFNNRNTMTAAPLTIIDENGPDSEALRQTQSTRIIQDEDNFRPPMPPNQSTKQTHISQQPNQNAGTRPPSRTQHATQRSRTQKATVQSRSSNKSRSKQRKSQQKKSSIIPPMFWNAAVVIILVAGGLVGWNLMTQNEESQEAISSIKKELTRQQKKLRRSNTKRRSEASNRKNKSEATDSKTSESDKKTSKPVATKEETAPPKQEVTNNNPRIKTPAPVERAARNPNPTKPKPRRPQPTVTVKRGEQAASNPATSATTPGSPNTGIRTPEPAPVTEGRIRVNSIPSARLFINDRPFGVTNDPRIAREGIKLEEGVYKITIQRPGYEPAEERVKVSSGENLRLNYVLSKLVQTIPFTIQTNRIPVLLYIEDLNKRRKNQYTITDPTYVLKLDPGSYKIELVYTGKKIERVIELTEGMEPITFHANFD